MIISLFYNESTAMYKRRHNWNPSGLGAKSVKVKLPMETILNNKGWNLEEQYIVVYVVIYTFDNRYRSSNMNQHFFKFMC